MTDATQNRVQCTGHGTRDRPTPAMSSVDDLIGLSDREFRDHLVDHLHDYLGETPAGDAGRAAWATLTDHRIVLRTRSTLGLMHDQIDQALSLRARQARSSSPPLPEYRQWREKTVHLKRLVQGKLRLIRDAVRDARDTTADAESAACRRVIQDLATAIDAHRRASIAADRVPEDHDRDLWAVLHRLTIPDGPHRDPTPLRTLVDRPSRPGTP